MAKTFSWTAQVEIEQGFTTCDGCSRDMEVGDALYIDCVHKTVVCEECRD